MPPMSTIGERVRQVRTDRGLSQPQLAELAGTTETTLSRIENGRVSPTLDTLINIARALDVRVGDLIDSDTLGITEDPTP